MEDVQKLIEELKVVESADLTGPERKVVQRAAATLASLAGDRGDLEKLLVRLADGAFYSDYDEAGRLVGVLRSHVSALAASTTATTERNP